MKVKVKVIVQPDIFEGLADRQDAYKAVFGTDIGKMVLQDLLNFSSIDRTAFAETERQTCLNLGKQMMGFHIKRIMNIELTTTNEE